MKKKPRMTFNKQFMLLLFMIISFKAGAQTDPVLVEVASVEELIKLIRTQNPDLKSYLLNVEKSSFEVKASKSVFLPSVTGSFGGQKNFELPVTPVPSPGPWPDPSAATQGPQKPCPRTGCPSPAPCDGTAHAWSSDSRPACRPPARQSAGHPSGFRPAGGHTPVRPPHGRCAS